MKTKLFFIAVSVLLMFSCKGNNHDEVKINEDNTEQKDPNENEVNPPNNENEVNPPNKESSIPKLVFTGNDIISFNVTTAEILLVKAKWEEIRNSLGLFVFLDFYIDDKSLFVPSIEIHSPVSSIARDDLQMYLGEDGIVHLAEPYQAFDWLPEAERAIRKKKQEENAAKRKIQMDVFIKYLSDLDKLKR